MSWLPPAKEEQCHFYLNGLFLFSYVWTICAFQYTVLDSAESRKNFQAAQSGLLCSADCSIGQDWTLKLRVYKIFTAKQKMTKALPAHQAHQWALQDHSSTKRSALCINLAKCCLTSESQHTSARFYYYEMTDASGSCKKSHLISLLMTFLKSD